MQLPSALTPYGAQMGPIGKNRGPWAVIGTVAPRPPPAPAPPATVGSTGSSGSPPGAAS
jgi:hypothetical protein